MEVNFYILTERPLAVGGMAMEQRKAQPLGFLSGVRHEHLVAGVGGGLVSTLVLHPLDLLKIRFAVHDGQPGSQRPHYAGLSSAVRSIAGTEGGVRGLYAGVTPNLVGAGSAWGLYFFFYNGVKYQLQGGVASKQLPASSALLAASFSGVLTLTLTNPVWVVKTRLCLQSARLDPTTDVKSNPRLYRGFFDALRKIAWYEGLRGLYSGYVPGLFGVSHGAVQFVAYEELKNRYHNYYHQVNRNAIPKLCHYILSQLQLNSELLNISLSLPFPNSWPPSQPILTR